LGRRCAGRCCTGITMNHLSTARVAPLETPSHFQFEFDSSNRILLVRFEGRLTDDLLKEFYQLAGKYWTATKPRAGIADYSWITGVDASAEMIRRLANQEPTADVTGCPRIIVAPHNYAFGLARMFQIVGEAKRPLLSIVRTLDEAFAALEVRSPYFEPLD